MRAQLIGAVLVAIAWAIQAQDFSTTIRILKSNDRVKIGGRSYKVKRTKSHTFVSDRNGSCVFDGQLFRHGGNVHREDACDKCMCFSGDVLCWKTSCPPMKVAKSCREVRRAGMCCPLVECDPEVPLKNSKHQGFTAKKQRPFVALPSKANRYQDIQCELDGRKFHYGQIVPQASGACMECRCGLEGQLKCKTRKCYLTGVLDLAKAETALVGNDYMQDLTFCRLYVEYELRKDYGGGKGIAEYEGGLKTCCHDPPTGSQPIIFLMRAVLFIEHFAF